MEKIIKDLKEMILLTQGVYAPDKAIINISTDEARQIVEALEGREWVPFSERWPEERRTVLLWVPEYRNVCSGHTEGSEIFKDSFDYIGIPTRWMPVPTPPQTQEGEG